MQPTIQFSTKSRKTEMKPIIAKMQVVRPNSARLMMRKKNKPRRRRAKSLKNSLHLEVSLLKLMYSPPSLLS